MLDAFDGAVFCRLSMLVWEVTLRVVAALVTLPPCGERSAVNVTVGAFSAMFKSPPSLPIV